MKLNHRLVLLLVAAVLAAGCVTSGPAVSKSSMGNLEINVSTSASLDANINTARIYIDDVFIGNVSSTMPVLYLKRGKRAIRVELDGAQPYQQSIDILGDPNHQVLNVMLMKK